MIDLYKKLQKVKEEIDPISKDKTNPHFKSKYFDINKLIEVVEETLNAHDLLLLQPIINGYVTTQIINLGKDNEMVTSSIELPTDINPQKIVGAITYYRRASLQSLLGLQAEDDDGNTASAKPFLKIGGKGWIRALELGKTLKGVKMHYDVSKENGEQYEKELNGNNKS